jgi:hypothetical protein
MMFHHQCVTDFVTNEEVLSVTHAESSPQSLMSLWWTFMIVCRLSLLMRMKREGSPLKLNIYKACCSHMMLMIWKHIA